MRTSKPHIAINHFLRKLKAPRLYKRMVDIKYWRKDERLEKENFNRFIREVGRQAEKIQMEQRLAPISKRERDTGIQQKGGNKTFRRNKIRHGVPKHRHYQNTKPEAKP